MMTVTLDTSVIDLGKDVQWITRTDASRQITTVNYILRRFFGPRTERRELQVLADEVGMGKTFVALGVAHAILTCLRDRDLAVELDDATDSYRCVLVITPGGNPTLAYKWDREDEALLTRCAVNLDRTRWFQSKLCNSADELLQAIVRADDSRRRNAPVILVAQSNVFTSSGSPILRFGFSRPVCSGGGATGCN